MCSRIRVLEMINDGTIGGGQMHVIQILKNLDRTRFEPFIACSRAGELLGEFEALAAGCVFSPIGKRPHVDTLLRLGKFIKTQDIQIVHTHGGIAGLWGRLAAWMAGAASVHTLHGIHFLYYENALTRKLYIQLERFLGQFTDRVICVAESDRQKCLEHKLYPADKCTVIKNGILLRDQADASFDPAAFRKSLGIENSARIIGHVARLHHQKGQRYLLEAFEQVLKRYPDTVLLIVGDGPLRNELETLASDLRLADHVRFLGFRQDVPNILSVIDLFVLSSLWEGLPIVLLEAMAMGKPVVSTDVDGIRELIVQRQEGLLAPPKNPARLAEAMSALLMDHGLADDLGRRAHNKIYTHYGVEQMVKAIETVYASCCG